MLGYAIATPNLTPIYDKSFIAGYRELHPNNPKMPSKGKLSGTGEQGQKTTCAFTINPAKFVCWSGNGLSK